MRRCRRKPTHKLAVRVWHYDDDGKSYVSNLPVFSCSEHENSTIIVSWTEI